MHMYICVHMPSVSIMLTSVSGAPIAVPPELRLMHCHWVGTKCLLDESLTFAYMAPVPMDFCLHIASK